MKKVCLIKDCGKSSYCRGLCVACHRAATRAIKLRGSSWDELEKLGLALKIHDNSPFHRAVNLLKPYCIYCGVEVIREQKKYSNQFTCFDCKVKRQNARNRAKKSG